MSQETRTATNVHARSRRSRRLVIASGFAICGLAIGVWIMAKPSPIDTPSDTSSATESATESATIDVERARNVRYYEREGIKLEALSPEGRAEYLIDREVWAHAEFAPAAAPAELMARWDESSLRDPDALLDAAARDALLRTIARHADVRGRSTPDAYIRLVEEQPGMGWNSAEATRNHVRIKACFTYFVEAPIDDDADAITILRLAWDGLARHGHLFDEVGVGEDGAAILVRRIRTPREAMTLGVSGKHALDRSHWNGVYYRSGMAFSKVDRTLEEALQESPSALIAYAHVLVRLRDGRIVNWISIWMYDEGDGQWRPHYMQTSALMMAMVVW